MGGFFISGATVFLMTIHIALSSDHQYVLESSLKTWTQAKQYCEATNRQLAIGNISDIQGVVPSGTSAFIGMVEIDEWLWFEGCYTVNTELLHNITTGPSVQHKTSSILFSSCVAECYDYQYIAVSRDFSCFCIHYNSKKFFRTIPKHCQIIPDTLLMRGGNSRLFLYRIDHGKTNIEKLSRDSRYGSIRVEDKNISGWNSEAKQNVLYKETSRRRQTTMTWKSAVDLYLNGTIYFEFNLLKTVNCGSCPKHHTVWVGLFKLTVQKKVLKDVSLTQMSNFSCGRVFKRNDSTIDVTFGRCDEKGLFICESLTKSNSKSNRENQTENSVDLEQTTTENWNSGEKRDTSPHHPSTTSEFTSVAYEGNGSEETDLTVVMCIVAGVLVLIIAIGGGYMVIKRFKRQKNEKVPSEDRYIEVKYIPEDSKTNKEATDHTLGAKNDNGRGVKNDTAGSATEGEYDVFCRRHQKTDTAEDLYDHARAPNNDDNYDHMPNFKVPKDDAGDMYDHTTNTKRHRTGADDTYDHTHIAHTGADNYDHLANVTPNDQKD